MLAERGLHLVRSLEGDQLRAAIEGPAAQAGLRLERGLVDLVVRDAEGEPGAMPLMSHALAETWARRDGRVLTVEGYRAAGGIRAAVARSADRLYESLPPDERTALRSVLLRMVAPAGDGEPYRSRVPTRTLGANPANERVVNLLVRARLVTVEADSVELAHEALARAWPRLRSWLDEDAEGQKIFRHVAAAADGWESLGREPTELYRGARLEQALEWQASSKPDLTPVERAFLDASVAAAVSERAAITRQNRRLRRLVAGIAVLLVAALVAGSVALWQDQRANHNGEVAATQERVARLRAVVSDSKALRTTNRDVAALLAVEAHRLAPAAETESALFSTFTGAPGLERIGHINGRDVGTVRFLPDGKTVALSDDQGAIHLVDTERAVETATLPALGDANGRDWLSPSADGRWLAVAWRPPGLDEDRVKVTVYDVQTGSPRFRVDGLPFVPGSLAVNGDGSIVAVAGGGDGRIQLRSGVTGELLREVDPVPKPADAHLFVNTAAVLFSGDQLIVTSQAGPIRWIDPATGTETKRIVAVPETAEYFVRPSPDGKLLATDGWAGHMLYDVATGAAGVAGAAQGPVLPRPGLVHPPRRPLCTDPHDERGAPARPGDRRQHRHPFRLRRRRRRQPRRQHAGPDLRHRVLGVAARRR